MGINILTSMFPAGFTTEFSEQLQQLLVHRNTFAFVASEFEQNQEKTDEYFSFFLNMFHECGIYFENACVVDARMKPEEAQRIVETADVVWLAGGDTPKQYAYFNKYGLITAIRNRNGITIGMSAGAINMCKLAICTKTCGHEGKIIYKALGLVDCSIEPHLEKDNISEEVLQLSQEFPIYGLCDDGVIIADNKQMTFLGDVYMIHEGNVTQVSEK